MHQAVGLYYNVKRSDTCAIARHVADLFHAHQVAVYASDQLQASRAEVPYLPRPQFLQTITLMVVIGGDGTFLRAASVVRSARIPLIGINQGTLGFLAELELEDFEGRLDSLIAGEYGIEERMTISGELYRDDACICQTIGLNDVTINRDPVENTLELDVYLEEQLIDCYQADGIIVATPTGSTGYSMSAGGPLIYPGTECLIVNPICAHVLGTNAIIVPAADSIDIHLARSSKDAYLLTDGRYATHLRQGDTVRIHKADLATRIVQMEKHQFFETVRNKLLDRNYRRMHHRGGLA